MACDRRQGGFKKKIIKIKGDCFQMKKMFIPGTQETEARES